MQTEHFNIELVVSVVNEIGVIVQIGHDAIEITLEIANRIDYFFVAAAVN